MANVDERSRNVMDASGLANLIQARSRVLRLRLVVWAMLRKQRFSGGQLVTNEAAMLLIHKAVRIYLGANEPNGGMIRGRSGLQTQGTAPTGKVPVTPVGRRKIR